MTYQLPVVAGLLLMLAGPPAHAQSGDMYAAPGFPLSLPRRVPPPPPPPPADAVVSPILLRFWHDQTHGRERASDFYRFMSTNLKYPDAATKSGMVGRIFVRLTVGPNGRVNDAQVVRSQTTSLLLNPPTPALASAGTAALEAETLRIFRAARFQVAKAVADTVTVSASFQIE